MFFSRISTDNNSLRNVEVAVDRMETQITSTVKANVGNEREIVREVGLAEAKQQADDNSEESK